MVGNAFSLFDGLFESFKLADAVDPRAVFLACQVHARELLNDDQMLSSVDDFILEFYDAQRAPLRLLPATLQEPVLDAVHELGQVRRIGSHDRVEFGEFARPEEYFGQAKLEVLIV